jgi:hypothetical protein
VTKVYDEEDPSPPKEALISIILTSLKRRNLTKHQGEKKDIFTGRTSVAIVTICWNTNCKSMGKKKTNRSHVR